MQPGVTEIEQLRLPFYFWRPNALRPPPLNLARQFNCRHSRPSYNSLNGLVHIVRIAVRWCVLEALALAMFCLSGALFPLRAAHAGTVDPGDYVAAPPGTNILVQYLQYGRDDGINIQASDTFPRIWNQRLEYSAPSILTERDPYDKRPQTFSPFA
jgi:hypothetical protein